MTIKVDWLGSPNFSPARDGHDITQPPSWIVIHTMVGTLAAADARFRNGDPNQARGRASAHYGVGLDGRVVQWVKESDAAWHSGSYAGNPGSNLDSIGIEHEDGGNYDAPRTDALYTSSAALVAAIAGRYPSAFPAPLDRSHIIKHLEVFGASTRCPDALDIDRIVREANQLLQPQEDTEHMDLFRSSEKGPDGNPKIYVIEKGRKRHLEGAEYNLWVKAGAKITDVDATELAPLADAGGAAQGNITGTLVVT